jgi:predicted aconitase
MHSLAMRFVNTQFPASSQVSWRPLKTDCLSKLLLELRIRSGTQVNPKSQNRSIVGIMQVSRRMMTSTLRLTRVFRTLELSISISPASLRLALISESVSGEETSINSLTLIPKSDGLS